MNSIPAAACQQKPTLRVLAELHTDAGVIRLGNRITQKQAVKPAGSCLPSSAAALRRGPAAGGGWHESCFDLAPCGC